jgi:hypothetical protein
MEYINFSKSWNNKLCCMHFSTIRPHNEKYQLWHNYEILQKDNHVGIAKIVDITTKKVKDLIDFETYLDASMNVKDFKDTLCKIYSVVENKIDNFEVDIIVLVWVFQSTN